MLRLAGCSSGRGVCARGGWAARRGRVCWGVLRSDYACRAVLLGCLALVCVCRYVSIDMFCVRFTPVSFPLSGKERRLAMCCVSIPPWVGIALVRSRGVARLSGFAWFTLGWCVSLRRSRRRTERREETRNGGRRRGASTLLRKPLGLVMFSAGRTLGLKCGSRTAAAPDCAKESKVEAALRPLWPLFI